MRTLWSLLALCVPVLGTAQWVPSAIPTTVDLLAVHAIDHAVWVSGANGTVLRSADDGETWTACAVPQGAAKAEIRSVQGVDAMTAVAMTAGKGTRSQLYRTSDGCKSWNGVFSNPEQTSSFDSLKRVTSRQMYLLAEPVGGKFAMYLSQDAGLTWFIADDPGLDAAPGETAASSELESFGPFLYFGAGDGTNSSIHFTYPRCNPATPDAGCAIAWGRTRVGTGPGAVRSVASRTLTTMTGKVTTELVAVGTTGSAPMAAYARGTSEPWLLADVPPSGLDAVVAFDGATQVWIAVGAGGTDLSFDGGKHWKRTKNSTGKDGAWTAMSLPFAVGPKGAFGKLDRASLKP